MVTPPRIACLVYHEVTDDPTRSGFQRPHARAYKHTRGTFAEHLDAIEQAATKPRLVTDLDLTRHGDHLLLTFDDGGKSALQVGEELCRRGWRGHFLITTGLIGSRTFLDKGEIRALRSCGHVIGTHSHTHPDIFRSLPFNAMVGEWRTSCDILAQTLSEACEVGSVPGGDISHAVLESASAAGLRHLFTSEPWLTPWRVGNCWMLGRVTIKANTSVSRVRAFAQMRGWTGAFVRRRLKEVLKTLMYPLYREYVRRGTRSTEEAICEPNQDCSPRRAVPVPPPALTGRAGEGGGLPVTCGRGSSDECADSCPDDHQ